MKQIITAKLKLETTPEQFKVVPVSPKARRANRHASKWAFAELQNIIAYKAARISRAVKPKLHALRISRGMQTCGGV